MVYWLLLFKYSNIQNVAIVYHGDTETPKVCNALFWTEKSKSDQFS